MSTYFVTRHSGAREWAATEGFAVDTSIDHLDTAQIQRGDVVIGSLPVHLAAAICARGGRYLHLVLDVPPALRGRDLSADEMRAAGARLEEYLVQAAQAEESR